jgi:hypothetical protein
MCVYIINAGNSCPQQLLRKHPLLYSVLQINDIFVLNDCSNKVTKQWGLKMIFVLLMLSILTTMLKICWVISFFDTQVYV